MVCLLYCRLVPEAYLSTPPTHSAFHCDSQRLEQHPRCHLPQQPLPYCRLLVLWWKPSDSKPNDLALDFECLGSSVELACTLRTLTVVPQALASGKNRWVVEAQDDLGSETDGLEVREEDRRRTLSDGGYHENQEKCLGKMGCVVADNTDWVALARLRSCQVTIHRHSRTRKSVRAASAL